MKNYKKIIEWIVYIIIYIAIVGGVYLFIHQINNGIKEIKNNGGLKEEFNELWNGKKQGELR